MYSDARGKRGTVRKRSDRAHDEFEVFVAEQGARLLRTAYLVVCDAGDAEDVVQECFSRVARRWPKVRVMDHPAAYARRVVVNLAIDHAARRNRQHGDLTIETDIDPEPADPTAAVLLSRIDDAAVLLPAIGQLPPRQRAVLVLRYFEDLTEAQTAEVLGCSVGTVKSATARAILRLHSSAVTAPRSADSRLLTPKGPHRD
jgi:RNA polymerase sigma-70 factor (sigma-E family)